MDSGGSYSGRLNATDAEGDPLTFELVEDVSTGRLAFHSDGSYTYTAPAGYMGSATFRYRVNDGHRDSIVARGVLGIIDCNFLESWSGSCKLPGRSQCDLDGDGFLGKYDRAIFDRYCHR